MKKIPYVSSELCPLCNKQNNCGNLVKNSNTENTSKAKACWCMESDISFPSTLLSQVANAAIDKACICEMCAKSIK